MTPWTFTACVLEGKGHEAAYQPHAWESHTTCLLSICSPSLKSKFGVGLTKGTCPAWARGVGRYGRLRDRKGHLFLTLFFQSFLLFHFLVLVPQFYPRCNASRRERHRVRGWSDRRSGNPPPQLLQAQTWNHPPRGTKTSSLRGRRGNQEIQYFPQKLMN